MNNKYKKFFVVLLRSIVYSFVLGFINKFSFIELIPFGVVIFILSYIFGSLPQSEKYVHLLLLLSLVIGTIYGEDVLIKSKYKSISINQVTFYYKEGLPLHTTSSIEEKKDQFKKVAKQFFDEEILNSKVDVFIIEWAEKHNVIGNRAGGYNRNNEKIILRRHQLDVDPLLVTETFYHEYVHHLVKVSRTTEMPSWFEEGLADYIAKRTIGIKEVGEFIPLDLKILEDEKNWEDYEVSKVYASNKFYIEAIISFWGEQAIERTLNNLSNGDSFTIALEKGTGVKHDEITKLLKQSQFKQKSYKEQ